MNPKDYRRIVQEFNDDWDHYFIVDITEPLVKRACQLAQRNMDSEGTTLSSSPQQS